MATVTKPIALDESLNTTEQTPRNVADVLAQELARIAGRQASDVEYDNSGSGLSATDVQNALDEIVSDIPTVNDGTLTIQQNGETKGTFTANQSGNSTVNIETPTTDIQTAVDEFSTFNGGLLSECKVTLSPNQDLHGYDHPWVGGAGKNLYKMRTTSITQNGITVTANADGTLDISGTATATTSIVLCDNLAELTTKLNNGGTFILSFHNATYNSNTFNVSIACVQGGITKWITPNNHVTLPSGSYTVNSNLYIASGVTVSTVQNFAIQLEEGSTSTSYEPYENICPISGHTQVDVDVSDGQTTQEQITVNLGGTYYSGILDVVSGKLTVDRGFYTFNGTETWTSFNVGWGTSIVDSVIKSNLSNDNVANIVCSILKASTPNAVWTRAEDAIITVTRQGDPCKIRFYNSQLVGATASDVATYMSGVQICYELATPQTIQLSPTMVKALVGENHLSAPLEGQEITESKYKQMFTFDDVIAYIQSLS